MSKDRENDSKFAGPSQLTRTQSENEITPDKAPNKTKESKTTRKRKRYSCFIYKNKAIYFVSHNVTFFRWRSSISLEDEIDKTIDGELKQTASNYNLSEREVRKILTVSF